jgi:ADP-ribose pyrophosphatase
VAIIPLNKTGEIIFVRQYRHSVKEALLELPAGKLEQHELPLDCAKRELAEEIGLTGRFTKITEFYTAPGFASEIIHLFLADDLTSAHACKDEDEILSVETHPLQDAVSMISIGSIKDAKTIIGVLMLQSGLALRQELPSQAITYGVNNETTD